jgi:hypothetical protein
MDLQKRINMEQNYKEYKSDSHPVLSLLIQKTVTLYGCVLGVLWAIMKEVFIRLQTVELPEM